MIILGIDPGVATIGFGLVRAERNRNQLLRYGVITTPPGIPLSNRLLQISNDMEELIHAFHPDEMAVEELFFTKNIAGRREAGGARVRVYPHAGEAGGGGLWQGRKAPGDADDPAPAAHERNSQAG